MPLAEARLLAIEEDSSREGGYRRGEDNPGTGAACFAAVPGLESSFGSAASLGDCVFSPASPASFSDVACLIG